MDKITITLDPIELGILTGLMIVAAKESANMPMFVRLAQKLIDASKPFYDEGGTA